MPPKFAILTPAIPQEFNAARHSRGLGFKSSAWAAIALLPHAYMAGMFVVAIWTYCERLEPPARPAWKFRGLRTARGLLRREWHTHRDAALALLPAARAKGSMRRGA